MAIRQLVESPNIVCKGTIGLGIKDPNKSHPEIADHFVLDDAPEVKRVYGEEPQALDIVFPVDDLDLIIPSWFKYWSGQRRNDAGKIIDGTLVCIGDGPGKDQEGNEIAGVATWRDRGRSPPEDQMISQRDPQTGLIKRACWGTKCTDAGKCKQNMQVYCILPLVSPKDIYRIDTSSWRSMRSFFNTLNQMQMLGAKIAGRAFRVVKKEVPVTFWDKEKQKEFKSMKPLIFLEEWDQHEFLQLHGKHVESLQSQLAAGKIHLKLPSKEEAQLLPSPELYPTDPAAPPGADAPAVTQTKVANAQSVVADPDVKAAFDDYAAVLGKPLTDKDRLILVRQKEGAPDLKTAVLEAIKKGKAEIQAKNEKHAEGKKVQAKPAAAPKTETKPAAPPPAAVATKLAPNPNTPAPDADGIM